MASEHEWNLDAARGYVTEGGIPGPFAEITVNVVGAGKPARCVGTFRLNLLTEKAGDYVSKLPTGYRVQIWLEPDGSVSLGVRQSRKKPLAPYAIR